jgi:sugar lactone lactonase YvrE
MMKYAVEDITIHNGHIFTSDNKYYLWTDTSSNLSYWRPMELTDKEQATIGLPMGSYARDYVCLDRDKSVEDLPAAINTLNQLIERHNEN